MSIEYYIRQNPYLHKPCTRGSAFNRTFQDYNRSLVEITQVSHETSVTGEVVIASYIASRIGPTSGMGGVTPHIRTSKVLA